MPPPDEPIVTPRLRLGIGLGALGLGLMFLGGKALPSPVAGVIAGGIALGLVGLALVILEGLREPPDGTAQSR